MDDGIGKFEKAKSHHGDTEARRKSGNANYDFNFRFDIFQQPFVFLRVLCG
jgi:hypothetical protein